MSICPVFSVFSYYVSIRLVQKPNFSFQDQTTVMLLSTFKRNDEKLTRFVAFLWGLLPLVFLLTYFRKDRFNNYKIFRQVFYHFKDHISLYAPYPTEHMDMNHYGPLFSLIIAPFAILPDVLGIFLWNLANAFFLFWAIKKVVPPISRFNIVIMLLSVEMANSLFVCQFNATVAALILLSFYYTDKGKDIWATLCIMIGFYVKLYGIVGLAFFLFSKHKKMFVGGLVLWGLVLFGLPMLFSSPEYVLKTYQEWITIIGEKNATNLILYSDQDISIAGFIRRILHWPALSSAPFIIGGLALIGILYLKFMDTVSNELKLLLCSTVLMFPVLFSSGTEHPTFIIAMTGVAIWMSNDQVRQQKFWWPLVFLLIVFAGLGATDLFGKTFRVFMVRYSLKVVPFAIAWFMILYQLFMERLRGKLLMQKVGE